MTPLPYRTPLPALSDGEIWSSETSAPSMCLAHISTTTDTPGEQTLVTTMHTHQNRRHTGSFTITLMLSTREHVAPHTRV